MKVFRRSQPKHAQAICADFQSDLVLDKSLERRQSLGPQVRDGGSNASSIGRLQAGDAQRPGVRECVNRLNNASRASRKTPSPRRRSS